MKPIIRLVVYKQWKQITILIALILISITTLLLIQQHSNKIVKMPIAIQDLDDTKASQQFIDNVKKSKYVYVVKIPKDETYIEDYIQKKYAIVSLQIPESFSKKLRDNELKDAITLYYKEGFIGEIALEVTSKSLYEQQIPIIAHKHLKSINKNHTVNNITKRYKQKTPDSHIKQEVLKKHANVSIESGAIVTIMLFMSMTQILLQHRLKQDAVLNRLLMYPRTKSKLFATYVILHTLILTIIYFIAMVIVPISFSLKLVIITILTFIIYEIVFYLLLFKVQMMSHKLFISVLFTIAISFIYVVIQL